MNRLPEGVLLLERGASEFGLVKPTDVQAFYPKAPIINGLGDEISRIAGDQLVRATGYGSAFSGDASKTSLMDLMLIVGNPWTFYRHISQLREVKLGTTRLPGFHAEFNQDKGNFYLTTLYLPGSVRQAKIAVTPLDELSKHAERGRPGATEEKGSLYLAGRMHKAMFPIFVDNASPEEREKIDWSFNRARIDGIWLALGLMPRYFDFDQLAGTYVNLSYIADKRVEKANKSRTLLDKNYEDYQKMLVPMLNGFEEKGIISRIGGKHGLFEKNVSLSEEDVRKFLKESASNAFKVNFFQNIWTMGPLNGILYGLAKVKRARG
ncbi:hypothetical protein HYU94_00090 [Candidatus Daviesbacteria bacterium]|nr:hypothetical protein [Candidatus Daviesbacteria bacterium]